MAKIKDRASVPAGSGLNDDIGEAKRLELYRTQVEVVRVRDQILVVGAGACEEQTHHLTAEAAS